MVPLPWSTCFQSIAPPTATTGIEETFDTISGEFFWIFNIGCPTVSKLAPLRSSVTTFFSLFTPPALPFFSTTGLVSCLNSPFCIAFRIVLPISTLLNLCFTPRYLHKIFMSEYSTACIMLHMVASPRGNVLTILIASSLKALSDNGGRTIALIGIDDGIMSDNRFLTSPVLQTCDCDAPYCILGIIASNCDKLSLWLCLGLSSSKLFSSIMTGVKSSLDPYSHPVSVSLIFSNRSKERLQQALLSNQSVSYLPLIDELMNSWI